MYIGNLIHGLLVVYIRQVSIAHALGASLVWHLSLLFMTLLIRLLFYHMQAMKCEGFSLFSELVSEI